MKDSLAIPHGHGEVLEYSDSDVVEVTVSEVEITEYGCFPSRLHDSRISARGDGSSGFVAGRLQLSAKESDSGLGQRKA